MAARRPTRLPPEVNRYGTFCASISQEKYPQRILTKAACIHLITCGIPPSRILYVRNLPFNISAEDLYDVFGKYGAIRQIRIGSTKDTRGTAYVVYEDIFDAKNAQEHLSGFNVQNRYIIVLYHQSKRQTQKLSTKEQEEELRRMQEKHGVDGQQR